MKHGIELNGVANIKILLDTMDTFEANDVNETRNIILKQLNILERYMLAYNDAVNKGEQPPFWHDVRDNPKLYLTNRERTG